MEKKYSPPIRMILIRTYRFPRLHHTTSESTQHTYMGPYYLYYYGSLGLHADVCRYPAGGYGKTRDDGTRFVLPASHLRRPTGAVLLFLLPSDVHYCIHNMFLFIEYIPSTHYCEAAIFNRCKFPLGAEPYVRTYVRTYYS